VKLRVPLVLASASPRRHELLEKLGLSFEVAAADVDETRLPDEPPAAYVARLARLKATTIASRRTDHGAVLGADTTVVCDGAVLNKPVDLAESARMLGRLRGREHEVLTAVAVVVAAGGQITAARDLTVSTRVRFRDFSDATLAGYVASREGMDKAGAYGIQALGAALVSAVFGSYTNVVGLPCAETITLLESLDVLEGWP
jgi:septum formation protein